MTARRNLVLVLVQKHLQMLLAAATVMVLARLVSPAETGLFSTGVAITAVTHAVRDFGVGNYLIKEPQPSEAKTRTAFTVSLLIALGLSAALLALAGPAAAFYGQPRVASVIVLTTLGLAVSPFSTVRLALLLRAHRFDAMFRISLAGNLAGSAVALGGAAAGLGAIALALGSLASALALALAANLAAPCWRDYRPSLAAWRPIWRFGLHASLAGVAEQIGGRATDLIIAKALGFAATGLFNRAGTLITLFQDAVLTATMPVAMANMASAARRDGADRAGVTALLLTAIEYASVVAWPFFAALALFAPDAILVLFGAPWLPAAPYTRILSAAAALAVLTAFSGAAATAAGRADLLARYTLASQGVRLLLVALGSLSGLRAVALLLVAAAALQAVLAPVMLRRAAPVGFGQLAGRSWRSLAVTAIVAAALLPVARFADASALVRLLIAAPLAVAAWLAAVLAVGHPAAGLLSGALTRLGGRLAAWRA